MPLKLYKEIPPWTPWNQNTVAGGGTGGPPPGPTKIATYIGAESSPATSCPSTVDDWLSHGNPTIGPLQANKQFYSGTQALGTFSGGHRPTDNESHLPPDTLTIICYQQESTGVLSYVDSIPDNRTVVMVWFQEAEDPSHGLTASDFVSRFITQSNLIRSAGRKNVFVAQDSASSQYGIKGSSAYNGDWRVPAEHVDYYFVDFYQNTATFNAGGMATLPKWQRWTELFANQGRPLGIAEYGICSCSGDTARFNRLCLDAHTLRDQFTPGGPKAISPFPLFAWLYWWSNCQADQFTGKCGNMHQFTDAATIDAWKKIVAGNDALLPAGS